MATDIDKKKEVLKLYIEYIRELEYTKKRASELLKSLKDIKKVDTGSTE